MTVKITGVTANCGNSTLGDIASEKIVRLLSPDGPCIVVINCQEVNYVKQLAQLNAAIRGHDNLRLIQSGLMVTRTKVERDVIAGRTGIATFLLYNTDKIDSVVFDPSKAQEVRGENRNKGGYLNSLTVIERGSRIEHKVRTISAHLDSNSDRKRAADWQNIKRGNAFEASTWAELAEKVPTVQITGYDANIRSIWNKHPPRVTNLWREGSLNPRVAPIALSPIGMDRYSADNTYKVEGGPLTEDKKRPGYAKGGSLDFVSIQNNTQSFTSALINRGFIDAPQNLGMEAGTARDHNVIISQPSTIQTDRSEFMRVRQYVFAELASAAPQLAEQINRLDDTEENKEILLKIHQHYLSPNGALIRKITTGAESAAEIVEPYLKLHQLSDFINNKLQGIDALSRAADAVQKSFNPKRFFYTKTHFLDPNKQFAEAYKVYMDELEKKVPVFTDLQNKKTALNTALEALMRATKDSKKKEVVTSCIHALANAHIYPSNTSKIPIRSRSTSTASSVSTAPGSPDSEEKSVLKQARERSALYKAVLKPDKAIVIPAVESTEGEENADAARGVHPISPTNTTYR